tara:strand:+ start:920 stop:1225 length:306 start_codon:yes stop_codon:yes gene_type:complete
MANCEYRYGGMIRTAKTKEACAKLKVGYQKFLKDNDMDNDESRLKRNRTLIRGDDFQEKKKKKKSSKIISKIKKVVKQKVKQKKERRKKRKESKRTYNPYD